MDKALLLTLILLSLLLLSHDVVPLGRWNNLPQSQVPLPKRIFSTLLNSATGLVPTWIAWRTLGVVGNTPGRRAITIILCCLVLGELLSWWLPWLTGLSIVKREKLAEITAGTYTFVPTRHGVTPNALHCVIHLVTLLALGLSLKLV